MRVTTIDIGSYSVKFLESQVVRKQTTLLYKKESPLEPRATNEEIQNKENDSKPPPQLLEQLEIIRDHFRDYPSQNRLIISIPSSLTTHRFLVLPTKNKKKAELTIPFQLEDDIPFSLNQIHRAQLIQSVGGFCEALVAIVRKLEFQPIIDLFRNSNVNPHVITTGVSLWAQYIRGVEQLQNSSFCILDIGHQTTEAYFFHQGKLLTTHISYIAGFTIDQGIAHHYKISIDEARRYKHENGFFLPKNQYDSVNDDQRFFGELMHNLFAPLIQEFYRWNLGFRTKCGQKVDNIYLCGGTSQMKNIKSYLTHELNIKCNFIDTFEKSHYTSDDFKLHDRLVFSQTNLMAQQSINKSNFINLLSGEFAPESADDLPLPAMSFWSSRLAIIIIVFSLFAFFQITSMNLAKSELKKKITTAMNSAQNESELFSISNVRRFTSGANPSLPQKIKKELQNSIQEIKVIKQTTVPSAFNGFVRLNQIVKNTDSILKSFFSDQKIIEATFHSEDKKQFNTLLLLLEGVVAKDKFLEQNETDNEVKISFGVEHDL